MYLLPLKLYSFSVSAVACYAVRPVRQIIRDVFRDAAYPSLDLTRSLASGPHGTNLKYGPIALPHECYLAPHNSN